MQGRSQGGARRRAPRCVRYAVQAALTAGLLSGTLPPSPAASPALRLRALSWRRARRGRTFTWTAGRAAARAWRSTPWWRGPAPTAGSRSTSPPPSRWCRVSASAAAAEAQAPVTGPPQRAASEACFRRKLAGLGNAERTCAPASAALLWSLNCGCCHARCAAARLPHACTRCDRPVHPRPPLQPAPTTRARTGCGTRPRPRAG